LRFVHREFSYKSPGERILKIGPHLPKLLLNIKGLGFFFGKLCIYTGWAKKHGLFMTSDNFATTNDRKACDVSKVSEFCLECIVCMSVQLNILCLICINCQYPQNCIEFDNDA